MANQLSNLSSANDVESSGNDNRTQMQWMIVRVLFMVSLSLLDIYSDYAVMYSYIIARQFTLAALTFLIMKFSSVVSTVQSVKWYKQQGQQVRSEMVPCQGARPSENVTSSEPIGPSFYEQWITHKQWYVRWPWRFAVTILQLSTLLSYWNTFWAAWRSLEWWPVKRSSQITSDEDNIAAEDVEAGPPSSQALLKTGKAPQMEATQKQVRVNHTLQKQAKATWRQCKNEKFSECIIESLMQVLLQLTVVMQKAPPIFEYGYLEQCTPQLISIAISSLNIMIAFYKYLARVPTCTLRDDAGQPILDTHLIGYLVLNGLWHVLIAVSRVLLFSAVASTAPMMMYASLGILGLHWVHMAFSYLSKGCGGLWSQQCVLNVAKAWTYCWVHLSDEETAPSRGYYFKFYGLYVFEFCILLTLYLYKIFTTHAPFFAGELVLTIVYTFILGLVIFWAYYCIKLESSKECSPTESPANIVRNTNTRDNTVFQNASGSVGKMIQVFEGEISGPSQENHTSNRQMGKQVLIPSSN